MRLIRKLLIGLVYRAAAGAAPSGFPRTADGTGGTADNTTNTADRGAA